MTGLIDLIPLFWLAPVLVAVGYFDLTSLRIPNKLVLYALFIAVGTAPLLAWPEIGFRLMAAGLVFAACFAAFCARLMGGGDVKMLAALMLFIPSWSIILFAYVFSAALMIGTLVSMGLLSGRLGWQPQWAQVGAARRFPMGISIALAGLALPVVIQILN